MGTYTGTQIIGVFLISVVLILFVIPATRKILLDAVSYPFKVREYIIAGNIISFEQGKEEMDNSDDTSTFVDRYFVNIEGEDNVGRSISVDISDYLSLEQKHKENCNIKVMFFFRKYALIGDEKLKKIEVLESQIA
ncbi:hypothetical protein HXX01_01385 [Candidatus Nomurabacteria bacterium]|nr:hypothetical protein [Candidatus Nomurabacteria bacterium]